MAPKPFPFPVGVGVDICHLKRFFRILNSRQDDNATRWAKKVFTRQEWPGIWQSFHRAVASSDASGSPRPQLSLPKFRVEWPGKQKPGVRGTTLEPGIDDMGSPPLINELSPAAPSIPISKVRVLAQHLAGRWAAKEATVKASRHRKLLLKDISIVQCNPLGSVHALIAPKHATDIVMSPEVAIKRDLSKAQSPNAGTCGQIVNSQFVSNTQTTSPHGAGGRFFIRKARIREEDQQIAEISISHDNEYAVAVCMALAEDSHSGDRPRWILDDGLGEPLHEPEWGDSGYLEGEDL
ncbi:MAG: hypothetical protein Q9226_002523 [Calogaya cf. arnoldii]